jgi:hypothetical protein
MDKQKLIFSIGLTTIIVSAIWISLGLVQNGSFLVGFPSVKPTGNNLEKATNQDNGAGKLSVKTGLDYLGFPKELIDNGVLNIEKYEQLAGKLTPEEREVLLSKSGKEVAITEGNSHLLLNLFWALGLVQKNEGLEKSELGQLKAQGRLGQLASTGGWTLGVKDATEYFSSRNVLNLSVEQQKKVSNAAFNIYRPCCNNHTRFADCNHGMAMLGVLSLGVKQGLSDDELYAAALKFNETWFPSQYNHVAQYLEKIEKTSIGKISPQILLSAQVIGGSGHVDNIERPLAALNGNGNIEESGGKCSI